MKHLANAITAFRLLLLVPLWLMVAGSPYVATALFVVFLLLDGLDGFVARKLHIESRFGKNFDLIADGIGGLGTLCVLLVLGRVPLWFILLAFPALLLMLWSLRLGAKVAPGTYVATKSKHVVGVAYYGIVLSFLLGMSWAVWAACVFLLPLYGYRIWYHLLIVRMRKDF